MGKKSGPAAPPAPDPMATAQAQSTVNKDAAVAQANLNRINQYTPQGSIEYSQIGTNSDGTPKYSATQKYSADEQAKYDQGNQVAIALNNLASQNIGRVQDAQSTPFSYDGMTPVRTSVGNGLPFGLRGGPTGAYGTQGTIADPGQIQTSIGPQNLSADGQRVSDALYGQATSRLDPQYQQNESDIRSRLAAQGISENSDAYRRELDNFNRNKTDAYNQANFNAIQAGGAEQSRLFDISKSQGQFANTAQDQRYTQALGLADLFNQTEQQRYSQDQGAAGFNNATRSQAFNEDSANATFNNQARQQQIQEAAYLRNLPLNDIAALMSGSQVNDPNFAPVSQVGVAAPDYMGMVGNNYNNAVNIWQQRAANKAGALGSIFGALGSVGGAVAMSDMRLKTAIRRIGTLANGIPTYTFKYVNDNLQRFGVIAQEVFKVRPEAVSVSPSGYLAVNYAKVY